MESSSLSDVIGGRAGEEVKIDQEEETKTTEVQIDPAELNDIAQGEFRIETLRMKDAEQGTVLWESSDWNLASDEE